MTGRERRGDAGTVTAELAVAVPAVLLVLAYCLTGLALAVDQVRCVDAARVAARAASRGEPAAQVRAVALDLAPERSRVDISSGGRTVTVTVVAPRRADLLPGLPTGRGEATAALEPGAEGSG